MAGLQSVCAVNDLLYSNIQEFLNSFLFFKT